MAKFDTDTINFGRVEFTTSTVYVYRSFYDRFGCEGYGFPDGRYV